MAALENENEDFFHGLQQRPKPKGRREIRPLPKTRIALKNAVADLEKNEELKMVLLIILYMKLVWLDK